MPSTSSSIIKTLPPDRDFDIAAVPTTCFMTLLFLLSLAFNSITSNPYSLAKAWASVVLPQPGGPTRSAGFCVSPDKYSSTHFFNSSFIFECPATSSKDFGRYFSTHSICNPPYMVVLQLANYGII